MFASGGSSNEVPLGGKYEKQGKHKGCPPGWELKGIFATGLAVFVLFVAFCIVLWANSDSLEQTSRATVMMHEETVKMKEDAEKWIKQFRTNFHANQEVITTQQILDTIDKSHETIAWLNEVRAGIEPDTVHSLVKNVNAVIGNVAQFSKLFGDALPTLVNGTAKRSSGSGGEATLIDRVSGFVEKGAQLFGTITADEFHETFIALKSGLETVTRVSQNISSDKVNKIVDSTSTILSAAESEHIVKTISKISAGVIDIIDRFKQPTGLRLSLPIESPPAVTAAAAATTTTQVKKKE